MASVSTSCGNDENYIEDPRMTSLPNFSKHEQLKKILKNYYDERREIYYLSVNILLLCDAVIVLEYSL